MGVFYLKKNIIYKLDCLKVLESMESNTFDLIIADPPYFKICGDFDYEWDDINDYLTWCKSWLLQCERVLKPNGTVYLWGAIGYNKGFALLQLAIWIENQNLFKIQNWITQRNCRGRSPKKNFMSCREELLFMTKPNYTSDYTFNKQYLEEMSQRKDLGSNGKPRKNKNKCVSNVFHDFPENNLNINDVWVDIAEASQSSKERFPLSDTESFPTVKAEKLCERIILTSSNKNDLILIPFAGSGSEIISCIKNNRNFIACEINPRYVDKIIIPRIENLKNISPDDFTIIDELTIDGVIKNKNVTLPISQDIVD